MYLYCTLQNPLALLSTSTQCLYGICFQNTTHARYDNSSRLKQCSIYCIYSPRQIRVSNSDLSTDSGPRFSDPATAHCKPWLATGVQPFKGQWPEIFRPCYTAHCKPWLATGVQPFKGQWPKIFIPCYSPLQTMVSNRSSTL